MSLTDEKIERAVLGAMMIEEDGLDAGLQHLEPHHFNSDFCQKVFSSIKELSKDGKSIDMVTILEKARSKDSSISAFDVADLTSNVHSSGHIQGWINIVIGLSKKRELLQIAIDLQKLAISKATNAVEDALVIQQRLEKIGQAPNSKGFQSMFDIVNEHIETTEKVKSGEVSTKFITGLDKVDKLQKWQRGNVVVLAGRPGMGKSAGALQLAINLSKQGYKCSINSLEMPTQQLANRAIANASKLNLGKVIDASYTEEENSKYGEACFELGELPIYIDDEPALSITKMKNKLRRLKKDKGLDIAFIDYLQLMESDSKSQNFNIQVQEISKQVKQMAKELDILVFELSQLSRAVEQRGGDKRPMLSDLRDSGSIEQDADCVVFFYRPEYYGIMEDEEGQSTANVMEWIFAKNRNGGLGIARQYCDLSTQYIGNFESQIEAIPMQAEQIKDWVIKPQTDIDAHLF